MFINGVDPGDGGQVPPSAKKWSGDVFSSFLWTHAQRASMLYFTDVFFIFFFIPALVGQTAERIFTKLSHVVDIRHHLRTY